MKVALIETAWGERDGMLEIERGDEFNKAALELSNFMNTLDIPAEQHNKLVKLAVNQVQSAERGAFFQGFKLGAEFGAYENQRSVDRQKAAETSEDSHSI